MCVCACQDQTRVLGSEPLPFIFPPSDSVLWSSGFSSFLTQLLSSCESGKARTRVREAFPGFHVPPPPFQPRERLTLSCVPDYLPLSNGSGGSIDKVESLASFL